MERASHKTTKASSKPYTRTWYSRALVSRDCIAASPPPPPKPTARDRGLGKILAGAEVRVHRENRARRRF